METIFSKNKQFRCWATRELPAHPQDMSGWGEGAQQLGRWPGKSWGSEEEVRGGAWRLQRGGTIRASHSLTHSSPPPPPQSWSPARVLLSQTLRLSSASAFCGLTSSHPPAGAQAHPPPRRALPSVGARAGGTWEDGPGGTPVGHEGGAGAPGAPSWSLSHTRCLSISVLLCLSPRLCLCVSLPLSPRLSTSLSSLLCLATPGTRSHQM